VISILKKITVNDKWEEKHIIVLRRIIKNIFIIIVLSGLLFKFSERNLTLSIGSFVLGFAIIFLHVLLPPKEFLSNVWRYSVWLNVSGWASHFNAYTDVQQKTFGRKLPDMFSGGGKFWVSLLFFRMMPFVYPLYLAGLLFLIIQATLFSVKSSSLTPIGSVFFLITLSLLPVIIHITTGGLKVGKSFMSALLLMLLVPATALDFLVSLVSDTEVLKYGMWAAVGLIIVLQLLHTTYVLYSDTIPCRMAPTILRNKLKELGVNMFYTYNNPYNNCFVHTMMSTYGNEFKANFINSISEVKKGIVVIPNTSSKSVSMETGQYAILNGDFDKDSELNNLMENKKIEKIAIAKIRTMGNSKYYVHESEVTSYRELILKQISEQDRWRGFAWVIKVVSAERK